MFVKMNSGIHYRLSFYFVLGLFAHALPLLATDDPAPSPLIEQLQAKAGAGDADAEQKLGFAYYNGQGVPQDSQRAFALCSKAADQGNQAAMFNVAFMLLQGQGTTKDPVTALAWYLKLANAGLANAELAAGEMYADGMGTTKDPAQALSWYEKAGHDGNADACTRVGLIFLDGIGVRPDPALALGWFEKGAAMGSPQAEFELGDAYSKGIGTPRDIWKSVAWFQKAAIQGNNDAKIRLGIACLHGEGVAQNPKAGFTLLMNAAKDSGYAAYWVACCYRDGVYVTADPVQAYAWGLRASGMTQRGDLSRFMAALQSTLSEEGLREAQAQVPLIDRMMHGIIQVGNAECTFANGQSSVMHFEDERNFILIPVQTRDQSEAYLLFDTGATGAFLTEAFATKMGLHGNNYIPIAGIGANLDLARISDETDFNLPGMTFRNARWAIMPHLVIDSLIGRPIIGILGRDLIRDLGIRIDYTNHTIEFISHDYLKDHAPAGVSVPLTVRDNGVFVGATVVNGKALGSGMFLVDTGNDGTLSLSRGFQEANPTINFAHTIPSGSTGIGGAMRTQVSIASSLIIGGMTLPEPMVNLEEARQGVEAAFTDGIIGGEIWRRFNLVLDLPGQKLFLEPNAQFSDPCRFGIVGMQLFATGDHYDTLTVGAIAIGSASHLAGFLPSDVLTKFDELGTKPLTLGNVYTLLRQPGVYHLTIRRQKKLLPLTLHIEDLALATAPAAK